MIYWLLQTQQTNRTTTIDQKFGFEPKYQVLRISTPHDVTKYFTLTSGINAIWIITITYYNEIYFG